MSLEMALLLWSVPLLFGHIAAQGVLLTRLHGSRYDAGPRDENRPVTGLAGRAERALGNFLETYPAFIALALATEVLDRSGWLTQWGAGLYFTFRVVYVPAYLSGIPYLRSLVWAISVAGLAMMMAGLII